MLYTLAMIPFAVLGIFIIIYIVAFLLWVLGNLIAHAFPDDKRIPSKESTENMDKVHAFITTHTNKLLVGILALTILGLLSIIYTGI